MEFPADLSIGYGTEEALEYKLLPAGADNEAVRYTSSAPSIITISEDGKMKAVGMGEATIKLEATDGSDVKGSCLVSVDKMGFEYRKAEQNATLVSFYGNNITIPQSVKKAGITYTVDSIAPKCFEGAELGSLVIPASVQKYGADAFKEASIKNWTYNGTLDQWCTARFANAAANPMSVTGRLVLDSVEAKKAVIPSSIKELQPYTFYNCASLDSVEVNMFVKSIGDDCFAGTDIAYFETKANEPPTLGTNALGANIETLVVPQDYYGAYYTADGWKDAKSILSSNDKKTDSYFVIDKALYHLNKETGETGICNPVDAISQTTEYKGTIVLPSAVEYNHKTYPLTTIGASCFENNTAVDSIALPATIKTIDASAFSGCKALGANFLGSLSQWCTIKFADGTSNPMSIKGRLMLGGKELTAATIPSDVTEVSDYAFYGCTNLKSAEIGEQVESVGTSAFAGCTGITDLKLLAYCEVPAGVFISCPLVCVESGNEKFWQSISSDFAATLETAIVSDDYTGMCPMFTGYTKLKNITLSDKINSITSFEGCTSLTEFTIPEEVVAISENAFKNCRNLKTLNVSGNYGMSIDDNAFVNCTGLDTLNYGGDIVDWCSLEFSNKYSNPMYYAKNVLIQGRPLETLDVPDGSGAKYQNYAFINLKSLKKVVISSITGGLNTFDGCSNLEEIHLTGPQTEDVLMPAFKGEFDGVNKTTCKLYVPANLVSKYKQAYIWKDFLNILPLEETPEIVSVQSITFTEQPHTMVVGDTQTLQVEVLPANADNQTLEWSSADISVATVSSDGVVTAIAPGQATITASATDGSGIYAECAVTVLKPNGGDEPGDEPVEGWAKVTDSNIATLEGASVIRIYPHNKNVMLYVENEGPLNADEAPDGYASSWMLTDAGEGCFYIHTLSGWYWAAADNNSMSRSMACTQYESEAAKVALVWNPAYGGVAFKNTATGKYLNDLCDHGTTFNWWRSLDEALTGDSYSTFDLELWQKVITSLTFNEQRVDITKGEEREVGLSYAPVFASGSFFSVTSSDESVVSVAEASFRMGTMFVKLIGKEPGTATITVKSSDVNGLAATCEVTVSGTDGIGSTATSEDDGSAYYTLSGIKLAGKPTAEGVYIRMKNGRSEKITIKR